MLRVSDILNSLERKAAMGDPGISVPRDRLPPEYYINSRREKTGKNYRFKNNYKAKN